MRTVLIAAGLLALPFITPAQAQEWRPVARQCSEEIDRQAHCASCGSEWPNWVRCTAARYYEGKIPADTLEACIKQTWDVRLAARTPAAVGDPVAQAIYCAIDR